VTCFDVMCGTNAAGGVVHVYWHCSVASA
jgi:hypothetical protein